MARDGGTRGGRARVSILRRAAAAFATERGVFKHGVFVSIGDATERVASDAVLVIVEIIVEIVGAVEHGLERVLDGVFGVGVFSVFGVGVAAFDRGGGEFLLHLFHARVVKTHSRGVE